MMESYLQKILKYKAPLESSQLTSKRSLDEEETKYSLKTESIAFNESVINDFHDSLTDSISEGNETNFIQKVPVLACAPTRHSKSDYTLSFFEAVKENNIDVCKELLGKYLNGQQMIDVNYVGPENKAALHIIASEDYLKLCEIILDYAEEPQINIRDGSMQTPLHIASSKGHLKLAQLLSRSGADLNSIDRNGDTPLHLASMNGHGGIVSWILSRGPNIFIKNDKGKTAEEVSDEITAALYHKYLKRTITLPGPSITYNQKIEANRVRINEISEEKSKGKVSYQEFTGITQLGKGSFGEVFLVSKQDTGMLYAMKVLRKDKIVSHNLIRYALTERNVLSYIRHPFIVSLNYAFQTSEKLFLILDYCPGGDMSSHLIAEKRFTEQRARIYICEILLALEELHKRDIIFRDLKPDNIVLDKDGHALLTDFGLSKEGVYENNAAKSFCGSVAYLAPEMIKRNGHGKAVDWYLLGVVFYEMVVGMPPYFSSNKDELINNIQRGKLKIPASLSLEAKELIKDVRFI
jgi:Protein kinase domain/Ankyrin repeats (many copies)